MGCAFECGAAPQYRVLFAAERHDLVPSPFAPLATFYVVPAHAVLGCGPCAQAVQRDVPGVQLRLLPSRERTRDTATRCHCGARYPWGADHCARCYCEQYEMIGCREVPATCVGCGAADCNCNLNPAQVRHILAQRRG